MNILTVSRTCVGITFAFVAQLTYSDCAQLFAALQRLNTSLRPILTIDAGVVEAAPEFEVILVRRISLYKLLKRTTDP